MTTHLKKHKGSWGFTLVELLVAALIGAILLAATAGIVVQVLRIDREETGRLEVQSEQSLAVEFIAKDLAEAVFVYNDTFSAAVRAANADDPAQYTTPDGIPDLNQLLYDRGWILRLANRIPVLGFWKYDSFPRECYVPPNLQAIASGTARLRNQPTAVGGTPDLTITNQDWEVAQNRRQALNLVVYYLRRNFVDAATATANFDTSEGNASIERLVLQQFNNACTGKNPFYLFEPDPFNNTFLEWPNPNNQLVPATAQQFPTGTNTVLQLLIGNIFSTRNNAVFSVERDPVTTPVAVNPNTCSRYGLDAADLPLYTLGGVKPLGTGNPTTFPQLPVGTADRGFYTCVRRTPNANQPQDVILHVTSTALDRANPGLFSLYIRNANSLDPQALSSYLNTIETRVLSRGALSRSVS